MDGFAFGSTAAGLGSTVAGVGSAGVGSSEEVFDSALAESFFDSRCSWANKLLSIDPTATRLPSLSLRTNT